ncbi:hypothetical protein OG21DRAFT_412276 [Imleria badia]|nr:hypothetical protein OG21DRAFT_412276 [Imleria badia]
MGAPQLAENAPPRKRGELYGNRLTGLGRPSGAPAGSRSGSPLPTTDDSPGPRKRCISAGTALSSAPSSNFSTNEPVPAVPNALSGVTQRRNSLAVDFGSGRRVMSASDGDGTVDEFVDASTPLLSSLVPEKPPDTADAQPPIPESVDEPAPSQPQPSNPEAILQPSESPPVVEEPLPTDSGTAKVDTPAEEPPAPKNHSLPALYDVSQNVSQSPSTAQSSKDGLSVYESPPQSAISRPSPSLVLPLPEPAPPVPSSVPIDTPSVAPKSTPARKEAAVISLSPPPKKVPKQVTAIAVPAPNPTVPAPPSVPTPHPTTESRPQTKSTFKAVVHRKVTEPTVTPALSTLAPPATSQLTKQRRGVSDIKVVEVPPSPGGGRDLAVLLEDAAMLELRLTEGDGTGFKARELLETTPTSATFQPDPRQASASTLTEHAHVPSVDSGSQSVRSVSIPSIRESLIDGEIPEEDETDGRSLASTTFSQRSPSHRKYLSNIYRLTSRRSSSYMPGSYPRDSMSMSSEDSSPVTTPSDNGKRKGFGIAWPSSSPTGKKGSPVVSRSSSFADKIFNRNRTKSNVSTADQVLERNSLYESSQPNLTLSFPSELSPEAHPDGVDIDGVRPTSWISPGDSTSEFSPASSFLDKDLFDAFPSVPQTLPPGYHLDVDNASVGGRASTLPVNGRKQVNQRLSMASTRS